MDQHTGDPNLPAEPQQLEEPQQNERREPGFFDEKLALRGSIFILCVWALPFVVGLIVEAIGEDVAFLFGIFSMVLAACIPIVTTIFAHLFAILAIRSLSPDDPASKRLSTSHSFSQGCA